MSQSVVIWDNKTHSRDRHSSPQHAQAVIEALIEEGMGCEGKVFPVVAFVVPDDIKYIKQDRLGSWWVFTKKPVEGAEYAAVGTSDEYSHKTRTGWWTGKLFNLEK